MEENNQETKKIKLLVISGSLREQSYNKVVAKFSEKYLSSFDNVNIELIDIKNYNIPLYNWDLENKNGLPIDVQKLKRKFESSDGYIVLSPEYNGSYSGVLKNIIDWLSRSENGDASLLSSFRNKNAMIGSVSPSRRGGIRCLVKLRMLLNDLFVDVSPDEISISVANEKITEGLITDKKLEDYLILKLNKFKERVMKLKTILP